MPRRKNPKHRPSGPPLPSWPRQDQPVASFTPGQLYAVSLWPIPTGVGCHPRTISDDEWVGSVMRSIRIYGEAQVLRDLIRVLRLTARVWDPALTESAAPPEPQIEAGPSDLPLPMIEDHSKPGKWTQRSVRTVALNLALVGIGRYPQLVPDERWLKVTRRECIATGTKQVLVDLLANLRQAYGVPGEHKGYIPFGYQQIPSSEESDDDN